MKTLDVNENQKTIYCIPTELRDEQIKINLNKVKGRVSQATELISEPIACVGFAPSLNDNWKALKKFKYIMTCSGAHKFLVEKGIIPTYHIDLDPRIHKLSMLGEVQKETEYLIASTIHPKYLDYLNERNANVKLWHIFANEAEAAQVLPRGEWMLSGGSSVGSRLLTMARFLGFTDIHVFGMDGSMTDKSHTTDHPNKPKETYETEYEGKKYLTTPSMLHVAKELFHELDELADAKVRFYGEGLIQAMAKNYVPKPKHGNLIAFNKPELISEEHKKLNWQLHQDNPMYGMGGAKHKETILKIYNHPDINSILDYGAGKRQLGKALGFPIYEYDPAVPEIAALPPSADLVVCSDVLEHIEPDKINFVLDDLKRCVKQVGYFVISTRKAVKTYSNGENAHLIVQGKEWWQKKLAKFFDIGTIVEKDSELQVVVSPKKIIEPETTSVEKNGTKVKFFTPNDTTKWRANTLFTKEPSTIEWIEQMQAGDVMYDVGANVGSYTILAGAKGVKVFAFEPEAENYALLVRNMQLNNIEPNAYCLAISDEERIGTLYGGGQGAGGACHTFNEDIGFDLTERQSKFTQGSVGIPLDSLVENGMPSPQHLKIDVDGLEFKVINGAEHILMNGLKSLLVEVNPSLPQHREMLEKLKSYGFVFDQAQVDRATRKEGTFKGCAEYVFRKENELEKYLKEKIDSAELINEPYPHFFIEDIFPKETYKQILKNFPKDYTEIEKSRGTKGYPKRFTANPTGEFWDKIISGVRSLKNPVCNKFGIPSNYSDDTLLIRDKKGYFITPHTDMLAKVVSALFYLPKDKKSLQAGTNIYEPKEKGFTCKQGFHYDFGKFKKIKSFPYQPNSLLVFLRTDNSFHGVEPSEHERNVLLYNIRQC